MDMNDIFEQEEILPTLPVEFDFVKFEQEKNERIEKYSELCNFKTSDIKNVNIRNFTIEFQLSRYIGDSCISSIAIFDKDKYRPIKVPEYYQSYLRK